MRVDVLITTTPGLPRGVLLSGCSIHFRRTSTSVPTLNGVCILDLEHKTGILKLRRAVASPRAEAHSEEWLSGV